MYYNPTVLLKAWSKNTRKTRLVLGQRVPEGSPPLSPAGGPKRITRFDIRLKYSRLPSQNTSQLTVIQTRNGRIQDGASLGSPPQGLEGLPHSQGPGRRRPDEGVRDPHQDPSGPARSLPGELPKPRTIEEHGSSPLILGAHSAGSYLRPPAHLARPPGRGPGRPDGTSIN